MQKTNHPCFWSCQVWLNTKYRPLRVFRDSVPVLRNQDSNGLKSLKIKFQFFSKLPLQKLLSKSCTYCYGTFSIWGKLLSWQVGKLLFRWKGNRRFCHRNFLCSLLRFHCWRLQVSLFHIAATEWMFPEPLSDFVTHYIQSVRTKMHSSGTVIWSILISPRVSSIFNSPMIHHEWFTWISSLFFYEDKGAHLMFEKYCKQWIKE